MIKRIGWLNRKLAEPYLAREEMMLAPIYGNLLAHGWMFQSGALRSGRYWGLLQEKGMAGMMARFNDGNCMAQAAEESDLEAFLPGLEDLFFHTLWLLGCGHTTGERIKGALGLTGRVVDHLMLRQETPCFGEDAPELTFADFSAEPYEYEYLEGAARLLEACFHYRPSRDVLAQRTAERLPEEAYLLGQYGGAYVCQAHIQAWTPHFGHIGGVATLPEYGGRGFARRVTGQLCRYIQEAGRIPTLTVRADNIPALRLYERLGFVPVGRVAVIESQDEG